MNLYTLFIAVPSEASSVSEAFFRFSALSLTQIFGDQVIVSNCIEALETLVSGRILYTLLALQNLCFLLFRPLDSLMKACQESKLLSAPRGISKY